MAHDRQPERAVAAAHRPERTHDVHVQGLRERPGVYHRGVQGGVGAERGGSGRAAPATVPVVIEIYLFFRRD